jgi:nitroimidazol reductase NimA-like FMN-containing flavoprotein (pyridoxamine 5'-phosphate oxidase superfamily)
MTSQELDDLLATERTCRVATVQGNGAPHVVPLWFVWDGASLWLNSLVRSQRWVDLQRDPRVAVIIDTGTEYSDLRGAELSGLVTQEGEAPRTSRADARLAAPELMFARKYHDRDVFAPDGRHAWLRLTPTRVVSWDFRKL